MNAAWLLLLQAATPAPPAQIAPLPSNLVAAITEQCPRGSNGDIVVCGAQDKRSPYRLPLPAAPEDQPRKVRFHLPGSINGDAHLEQLEHDGIPDHRIMIHLSKRF